MPHEKVTMAMALEGKSRHYRWSGVRLRHWLETAKRCGFSETEALVREVVEQTPTVLAKVANRVPQGFPAEIPGTIIEGVRTAAKNLGAEIAGNSRG